MDGRGLSLTVVLTPGNVNDCTVFPQVLSAITVPRTGPGRPRCQPDRVIADKAYGSKAIRRSLHCLSRLMQRSTTLRRR
ncbi:hypothetical protein GCM10022416_08980 [Actinomadura keratinilytica]|uniref:Transposase IS4-like domain-containing protein n=1 Tax=Actinomadura keratinilytica TaxID=547461 RepID=A0ABP7Y5D3_9ACTN